MTAATSATHNSLSRTLRSNITCSPSFLHCVTTGLRNANTALEEFVDRNTIAIGEPVGFIGHACNGHKFAEHSLGHPGLSRGSRVAGDTIGAAIGDRHRYIDHFLGERIERARSHDFLDAFPRTLERDRITRKIFPEVIDVGDVSDLFDVVIDSTHLWRSISIFYWRGRGHWENSYYSWSWSGLSQCSTSLTMIVSQDARATHKAGHDIICCGSTHAQNPQLFSWKNHRYHR